MNETHLGKKICNLCNKEKTGNHISYCKECYAKYKREWYYKHKKEERIRNLAWQRKNKDKLALKRRIWRNNNKEHFSRYLIEYRKKNLDKLRMRERNKEARRRNDKGFNIITNDEWESIKIGYGNKCFYCKSKLHKLTMDHYIPLYRGGQHKIENIVPACLSCNTKKTYLMPEIFIERIKNERIRIGKKNTING